MSEVSVTEDSSAQPIEVFPGAQGRMEIDEAETVEETSNNVTSLTPRIAVEHNYAKLVPFRSSHISGKEGSFSTTVLFPERITNKLGKKKKKQVKSGTKGKSSIDEIPGITGGSFTEMSSEEGAANSILTTQPHSTADPSGTDVNSEAEEDVDITTIEDITSLPYDERKVSSIMVECARHVNLVRVHIEPSDSDILVTHTLNNCDARQRSLLKQLINVLEADKLAKLAYANVPHEPIKRRLSTDKSARKFRKILANIQWDSKLVRWCHETLLRVLDSSLLSVYLDVLQVLKAKVPVLVEHMIHTSLSMAGGDAFGLLLKRPWNPAVGLYSIDKQVKFDPAPVFISLPYSTTSLGGRRWRQWQNHLSVLGKVCPILPDAVESSHHYSLHDITDHLVTYSFQRVHELCSQFVNRPVVLVCFSLAGRIAAKISQMMPVSLIVSLGLPSGGMSHKWKVSSDPFKDCLTPTLFAVGSESSVCSVSYLEKLRSKMKCATSLVVVGGGDDMLRLSIEDKQFEEVTQSIVDRTILNEIYNFMVYNLPCAFPEDQYRFIPRKRKISPVEDVGSSFLTPMATSQGPVLFSPTEDSQQDSKTNSNNNNMHNINGSSTPFLRTLFNLKHSGRTSPTSSLSNSPSPTALLERRLSGEVGMPPLKRWAAADTAPKVGRPRSKSTAQDKSRKGLSRSRSRSSEQNGIKMIGSSISLAQRSSNGTFTPISFSGATLNSNSNNSNNVSPPAGAMLTVPLTHFRPLPITPPRNPFEDQNRQLDPKTLKYLQHK